MFLLRSHAAHRYGDWSKPMPREPRNNPVPKLLDRFPKSLARLLGVERKPAAEETDGKS